MHPCRLYLEPHPLDIRSVRVHRLQRPRTERVLDLLPLPPVERQPYRLIVFQMGNTLLTGTHLSLLGRLHRLEIATTQQRRHLVATQRIERTPAEKLLAQSPPDILHLVPDLG